MTLILYIFLLGLYETRWFLIFKFIYWFFYLFILKGFTILRLCARTRARACVCILTLYIFLLGLYETRWFLIFKFIDWFFYLFILKSFKILRLCARARVCVCVCVYVCVYLLYIYFCLVCMKHGDFLFFLFFFNKCFYLFILKDFKILRVCACVCMYVCVYIFIF